MAEAVAAAIDAGRHLVVQAGTGTGKTLAYLVPAIAIGSARRGRDGDQGPAGPAGDEGPPVPRADDGGRFRVGGAQGPQQLRLPAAPARAGAAAATGPARAGGDGARPRRRRSPDRRVGRPRPPPATPPSSTWAPNDAAWRSVSVGSDECPGADRCPMGEPCFAEQARRRAAVADVVVVNTHLYGLDVASGGVILPEHDVVVFDEAHVPGRRHERHRRRPAGARSLRRDWPAWSAGSSTTRRSIGRLLELAEQLREALGPHAGCASRPRTRRGPRGAARGPQPPRAGHRGARRRSRPRSTTPSNASCGPRS